MMFNILEVMRTSAVFVLQGVRSFGLMIEDAGADMVDTTVCKMSWFASLCAKWNGLASMHKLIVLAVLGIILVCILSRLVRGFSCCSAGCKCSKDCCK